jgi:hypothetical protein
MSKTKELMLRKSGFGLDGKSKEMHEIPKHDLGQNCPQHCPHPITTEPDIDPLGEPLPIREVARLIGRSEWTVRQRYVPAGLPCIRLGPTGKLIFYRKQVIAWLLEKQQKGGIIE